LQEQVKKQEDQEKKSSNKTNSDFWQQICPSWRIKNASPVQLRQPADGFGQSYNRERRCVINVTERKR